jgi:prophage regulatory protein
MQPLVLRRCDVEALTGLSRSTIYRLASAGQFPRPIRLGPRAVGWAVNEINCWLEERAANRDSEVAQ